MTGGGERFAARWRTFWEPARRRRRAALVCLGLAMAVSSLLILTWGNGQSFFADEWYYIFFYRGFSPDVLFLPEGGHLMAASLLTFNSLFDLFGTERHLPYEVTSLVVKLAIGGLVYVMARRRIGELWALVPAILVLFLGAGWELQSASFTLPNQLGLAGGLGALACLDLRTLRGDIAAAGLLALSLASFSVSLPFALGVAIEVTLLRREARWRRAWVWLVPLLLYSIWWAHYHPEGEADISNLGSAPVAMFEELASACAAITGMFKTLNAPEIGAALDLHEDWGRPLALALVGAVVLRIRLGPRVHPRFYVILAILLADLLATAMVLSPVRVANASRYAALATPLVLLLLVEMVAGLRWPRWAQIVSVGVFALSMIANVSQLHLGGSYFRQEGEYNRSELAALEIVRNRVPADLLVETPGFTGTFPHKDLVFPAGTVLAALDEVGSPAYSQAELADAGAGQREVADQLLGRALQIHADPVRRIARRPGLPVRPGGLARHATVTERGSCLLVRPDRGRDAEVTLRPPAGGFGYEVPSGSEARVRLGRFGDGFAVAAATVRGPALVRIPSDRSRRPWHVLVASTTPLTACPARAR